MIGIRISNEALDDLDEGFWFYEAQEAGLGDYFASQLSADIDGLKVTAGIHGKRERGYHRLLSHKFPYAVYYTFEMTRRWSWRWWIAEEIRNGFANIWNPDSNRA